MKKMLTKENKEVYYYFDGAKKIINREDKATYPNNISGTINSNLCGNIKGLRGDISGIYGKIIAFYGTIDGSYIDDIGGLRGDVSDLYGDISGIYGDCIGIKGNLDECEITEKDREKTININSLVK